MSNAALDVFGRRPRCRVFASSGLSAPEFLAFTNDAGVPLSRPVPEPASASFATLVAGVALLRRRPRRAVARPSDPGVVR